jgi:hypothetical protein
MRRTRTPLFLLIIGVVFIGFAITSAPIMAEAESAYPSPPVQTVGNDTCLACHSTPGFQTGLASGETLYLTVDSGAYANSTHGALGYACVQCHTNISGFPHDPITAETRRDFSLNLYTSCARCHQDKYDATLDSVHQKALAAGNKNAAICTDCHGIHNITSPDAPRSTIPHTCEKCHSEIYQLYAESVHGAALLGEANPDVPTCIDCHGVHDVQGPTDSQFHLFSPLLCAKCHADEELMGKYGISTDVFDTYISDFHGTTVALFEATNPDQETNKPVCIDCHGVHDMKKVDDPESRVMKENLLTTCQKCHPDATADFPSSWLGHYVPSAEHNPLVYFVDLFYKLFIPAVLIPMTLYVIIDFSRRLINRRREGQVSHD